jgi:hypothetical protein
MAGGQRTGRDRHRLVVLSMLPVFGGYMIVTR